MRAIELPGAKIQSLFTIHVVEFINNVCLECGGLNEFRAYVVETPIFCLNDYRFGGQVGGLGSVRERISLLIYSQHNNNRFTIGL
jgi:predicted nucleic-acid-binding Zn-ribbon protein